MHPRPCLFATLSAVLLSSALEAQARPVEHLLRLHLQPGAALHYRNTMVAERKLPDAKSVDTSELTIECNVGDSKEGKANVQQTVRRIVRKLMTGEREEILFDTDDVNFHDPTGQTAIVGTPARMKLDDRGRISDFEVSDVIAKAASPQIFFVHCITLPDLPVAVGQTWEASSTAPIPELGDREVKHVHKLASVTKDRATIETEVQLDAALARLPGGATIDRYRMITVIELTTGKLVESRMECYWSSGPVGQKREMSMAMKLEAIAPPPAKQGSAPAGAGPTSGKG